MKGVYIRRCIVIRLISRQKGHSHMPTYSHAHTTSHNTCHILDRWEHANHIRHSQFRVSSVTVVGFFQSFCNWNNFLARRNEKIILLRELYKINLKSSIFSFQTVRIASSVWELCRDLEAICSWNQKVWSIPTKSSIFWKYVRIIWRSGNRSSW